MSGRSPRIDRAGLLVVALLLAVSLSAAQSEPASVEQRQLETMMHLNRNGHWDQAAGLAKEFLEKRTEASEIQRCEARFHFAYATLRLSRFDEGLAELDRFEMSCSEVAREHWTKREMAELRERMDSSPAQRNGTAEDDFWKVIDAQTAKLDPKVLDRHRDVCIGTGADACLVVHRNRIVQEWTSSRYHEPMYAMSTTKSITALLVAMLVADGKIESLDEPVCKYIETWCKGNKGRVTLFHLMTNTSGLPRMKEGGVGSVGDKNPFVIRLRLADEPGARWSYSNEGVQLLSPILDKAAGMPIQDYARKRLFEPLGMSSTQMNLDVEGHAWTYADMKTTPRDLARIGVLMLDRGMWRGKRILPEEWVDRLTTRSQELKPDYGLLWWLHENPKGFAGHGYLDTNLYVFPELELVVVRMQFARARAPQGTYPEAALPLFLKLKGDS